VYQQQGRTATKRTRRRLTFLVSSTLIREKKESLRRLEEELESRIKAISSDTFINKATCSAYVCSFLTQAVQIFNGELTLAPERPLRGRHGHGKVDYAIETLAKDGTRHVLGVTEVKHENYKGAWRRTLCSWSPR